MEWIETTSGNRISKLAVLKGSNNIHIKGNCTISENVILNGEVPLLTPQKATIGFGKYCFIGRDCAIIPPVLKPSTNSTAVSFYSPVQFGSYVVVGGKSVVSLAMIGNRVIVEEDCKLHDLCVIYDCCIIRKGCVVPEKTIVPPFSEVSGVPEKDFVIKPLATGYKMAIENEAREVHCLGISER